MTNPFCIAFGTVLNRDAFGKLLGSIIVMDSLSMRSELGLNFGPWVLFVTFSWLLFGGFGGLEICLSWRISP